jgi:hypothetical protein
MSALIDQRCSNHVSREAVVRCPRCRRYFCRECVTEHRGQMMCASCVAASAGVEGDSRGLRGAFWPVFAAAGFLLGWLIFYYLGVMLARVPSDFFE